MCKTCCIIGHRKIETTEKLVEKLNELVTHLVVNCGVKRFLFGSKSQFNDLCHKLITNAMQKYPEIKRINYTCRNEYCTLKEEKQHLEKVIEKIANDKIELLCFEEEFEHNNKWKSGKACYIERNQAMINDSDFCIFYFDDQTTLKKSGTAIAYKYAVSKKKNIFNLSKEII